MPHRAIKKKMQQGQMRPITSQVPGHKISPPKLGPFILHRSDILSALAESLRNYSVWISGPPGSGKTVLATQFASTTKDHIAWYQMDILDSDPATFFALFPQAFSLESHKPPLLPAFLPENMMDIQVFSRKFFRRLLGGLPERVLIVLDNYQELDANSPVNSVIPILVEEIPRDSRLLVLSREGLTPHLAQSHAREQIRLFDKQKLRFTTSQIGELLEKQGIGGNVGEMTHALHKATLGWAAGIRLILEESDLEARVVEGNLDADYEYIFDYFASVIFLKLKEEEQQTLMKAAILPDLNPEIVARLCQWPHAESYLYELSKKNYFTYKIKRKENLYQFHPLFRRFLMKMAEERLDAKDLSSLRKSASKLLGDKGRIVESIELLFESGQWALCAEAIKKNALSLMMKAQFRTLLTWLQGMPEDLVDHDPHLLHIKGKAATPYFPVKSIEWLQKSFESFIQENNIPGALAACADLMRAIVSFLTDMRKLDPLIDFVKSHITAAQMAKRHSPVDNELIHSMLRALVLRKPDDPGIEKWRDMVEERVMPGPILPLYYIWTGRFDQAERVLKQYLGLKSVQEGSRLDLTAILAILLQYYLVTGQPDKCKEVVKQGISIGEESGIRIWQIHFLAVGAACCANTGNLAQAAKYLGKIEENMDKARGLDLSFYHLTKALYLLRNGKIQGAELQVNKSLSVCTGLGMPSYENWCRLGAGITGVAAEKYDEAKTHFDRILALCEAPGNPWFESQAHLGLGLMYLRQGNNSSAVENIKSGFSQASRHGYTTFFFFLPEMISELCAKALEEDIERDFVSDYIMRWQVKPSESSCHVDSWPWPVRIYTMGGFGVQVQGKQLSFPSKTPVRPLELLKVLICLGGHHVPDTQVMDTLWPGYEGDKQARSLKTTLHRLRKLLLCNEAILYKKGALSLNPLLCWVDAMAFKDLCQKVTRGQEPLPETEERAQLARQALSLYRGAFLPENLEESWTLVARSELQRLFRDLGEILGQLLEQKDDNEAVSHYRHVISMEPTAEIFYRRLMDCLIRLDRPAEAVVVYEQCRCAMEELLGITPSTETERLYNTIMSNRT